MATMGHNNLNAKLVLLGDMGAGKSSLVLRFVKGQFLEFQESTIGAAFFSQTLAANDATVKFEIWDTAGQERYHSLAPMYYRGAAAAIIVYDITSTESFVRAKKWVQELQKQGNPNMVVALAGNKADLEDKRKVTAEEARVYAEENGLFFMETSAKTAANVNDIFYEIDRTMATNVAAATSSCPAAPASTVENTFGVGPTVGNTSSVGPNVAKANPHVEKPQPFNGEGFKRWQQKMVFYLTTLNLVHILKEECSVTPENPSVEEVAAKEAWMHTDFLCRNYILSALADSLYNVYYTAYLTARQLWEALDKKYKLEDAGTKKFLVGKFLDYKMVDSKLVVNQLEELQIIISDLHNEGMVISEAFQVVVVIEKLPPSWKDFKNYLKHKRKELSMEDLAVRFRIEEDNRKGDRVSYKYEAKANIAERQRSQAKKQQSRKKTRQLGPKKNIIKRIQGSCWVCGKIGHRAADCRYKKGQSSGN